MLVPGLTAHLSGPTAILTSALLGLVSVGMLESAQEPVESWDTGVREGGVSFHGTSQGRGHPADVPE